jgi:DNA replication protein DnaC
MNAEEAQALLWATLQPCAPPCPHCGGLGVVTLAVPYDHELFGRSFKCVCQRHKALEHTISQALQGAAESIPNQSHLFDWHDFDHLPHTRAAVTAARAMAQGCERPGLIIWGSTGTGKTTVALIAMRYMAAAGQSVAWVDYTDLIKRVQSTYDRDRHTGPSEDEILAALVKADLLVIDDMGSAASDRPASENRVEIMFRIINGRYASSGRTIITTNLTPDHLRRQFGDRIYSRLAGMSDLAKCDGKDLRQ